MTVDSLYPFLYPAQTDVPAVLEQVRASTMAKAQEIVLLRQAVRDTAGPRLLACAEAMTARFAAGGRLLAFGNGGSATDAAAVATQFLHPGGGPAQPLPAQPLPSRPLPSRPLPALSLASDPAILTALANDVGVDVVFARQIAALATSADIAVGLSTSGNSANLLRAFDEASRRGLLTVGIAGYTGGKMAELDCLDFLFVAPSQSVHRVQEAQTTIYHVLWELCQLLLERER